MSKKKTTTRLYYLLSVDSSKEDARFFTDIDAYELYI